MSPAEFAGSFTVSLNTLRRWERGGRQPCGEARVLLMILVREPKAVLKALAACRPTGKVKSRERNEPNHALFAERGPDLSVGGSSRTKNSFLRQSTRGHWQDFCRPAANDPLAFPCTRETKKCLVT